MQRAVRSLASSCHAAASLAAASRRTCQMQVRMASSDAGKTLKKTLVYDEHVKVGGVMVDFADYLMPVQYKDSPKAQSIIDSTKHCREKAGLFDVSHMCSIRWRGKDAIAFVESVTVADVENLAPGTGTLSLITNEQGGIIDDTMITKTTDQKGPHIYQVVNAGCAPKDLKYFEEKLGKFGGDVKMEVHWDNRGLYALQGPQAVSVLQRLVPNVDFKFFAFGNASVMTIKGMECFVARCGYTGEDGFEIFVPEENAVKLWRLLMEQPEVMPSGLGARDALRLEAGLCLYGHDIDDTTSPSEAGLSWTIGKGRRAPNARPFPGSKRILEEVADAKKVRRSRVGLIPQGAPAREGSAILDAAGKPIGKITSGAVSPILKTNISMGYIDKPHNKAGTKVQVTVRGKTNAAEVVKMPFVPTKYYKGA